MVRSFNPLDHLSSIKTFEVAARHGSFKAAADELNITESAVSRSIRNLEEAACTKLFVREHRRVVLTDAGRVFSDDVSPALTRIRNAGLALTKSNSPVPLKIAAPATFLLRWFIPRQSSLQKLMPNTEILLVTWDGQPLVGEQPDTIFLQVGKNRQTPSTTIINLMPESFALVASPLILPRGSLSKSSFSKLPRLVSKTRPNIWSEWVKEGGVDLGAGDFSEFERMYFALQAAEAGLGITIAPYEITIDSITEGRLVAPFGALKRSGTYHLVVPNHILDIPSTKAAIQWFQSECGKTVSSQ